MAASRALTLVIALALGACSTAPSVAPTSPSTPAPAPTPSAAASPSEAPVPSPDVRPSPGVDAASGLRIPPPYELEQPSSQQLAELSGNIRGLPEDVAEAAGAGHDPSEFPLGVRFIRDGPRSVGAVALVRMPPEVASLPGLLESIAVPVAAEVNARLSYETVDGVKVAILAGPIASAVGIVHGHLVMAQSGQPAVHPIDLMAALNEANPDGFDG